MVIVILGPTGVGKTKMSIELAKRLNGEVINADSMQVYKKLNIGTAKVTKEEKENIPHHLFDIKEVEDDYTVYHYQKDARKKIDEVLAKGKTPILVGGTGLYIKAALYDYKFNAEEKKNNYNHLSKEEKYQRLLKIDPDTKIHPNNEKRVTRALEAYDNSGQIIGSRNDTMLLYDALFIGLTTSREILYDKINKRVGKMVEMGLLEEVKALHDKKIYSKAIMTGIGYKELYSYFDNECSLEEALDKIKQNSRKYAKRQYTFFNHQLPVTWFNVSYDNFDKTINEVEKFIKDTRK